MQFFLELYHVGLKNYNLFKAHSTRSASSSKFGMVVAPLLEML